MKKYHPAQHSTTAPTAQTVPPATTNHQSDDRPGSGGGTSCGRAQGQSVQPTGHRGSVQSGPPHASAHLHVPGAMQLPNGQLGHTAVLQSGPAQPASQRQLPTLHTPCPVQSQLRAGMSCGGIAGRDGSVSRCSNTALAAWQLQRASTSNLRMKGRGPGGTKDAKWQHRAVVCQSAVESRTTLNPLPPMNHGSRVSDRHSSTFDIRQQTLAHRLQRFVKAFRCALRTKAPAISHHPSLHRTHNPSYALRGWALQQFLAIPHCCINFIPDAAA